MVRPRRFVVLNRLQRIRRLAGPRLAFRRSWWALALLSLWARPAWPAPAWAADALAPPEPEAERPAGAVPDFPTYVHLVGHPTLLVGDSLIRLHPWRADTISCPGRSHTWIRETFEREIGTRRYGRIVIWAGSGDLIFTDLGIPHFVAETRRMVAVARAHAEDVVVLGPMPWDPALWPHDIGGPGEDRAFRPEQATAVVAAVRAALPDVPVIDLAGFYREAARSPLKYAYFNDGFHLRPGGYEPLGEYLSRATPPLRLERAPLPSTDASP